RLLRLNVYFDNPIPREGSYEDRGGYWAPVELWHREAEHWSTLYQKGMRVLVEGRTVRDEWEDSEDNARVTFKIEARRVGILPHRLHSVVMRERSSEFAASATHVEKSTEQGSSPASKPRKRRGQPPTD
ncbi:single-stranded DNA-binding protein, partial [Streptomyces sp. IBSBF 2807]|nr:single-stranded DNA-binding protein [Streptomyces hilarionis]